MDTDIFLTIPCLVVLNSLDGDDKGICTKYYPTLEEPGPEQDHYASTKSRYETLKRRCKDGYELYNILELVLFDKPVVAASFKKCGVTQEEVEHIVHCIKQIAMGLQRHRPSDWNSLMGTAMGLTA